MKNKLIIIKNKIKNTLAANWTKWTDKIETIEHKAGCISTKADSSKQRLLTMLYLAFGVIHFSVMNFWLPEDSRSRSKVFFEFGKYMYKIHHNLVSTRCLGNYFEPYQYYAKVILYPMMSCSLSPYVDDT